MDYGSRPWPSPLCALSRVTIDDEQYHTVDTRHENSSSRWLGNYCDVQIFRQKRCVNGIG